MKKLDINQSLVVNTNASKAWEIIGPNFLNISDWGRGVVKSWEKKSESKQIENAPATGRFCEVAGLGNLAEDIFYYNDEKYEISWLATGKKIPNFVSALQNEIKVEEIDDRSCTINSNLSANLNGPMGFLMGSMMKKNFTKLINGFLNDWKTYAETGEVSETKKREIEKSK